MVCNVCNNRNAVLYVQQVSVVGKKEIHLCAQCAKIRGIDVGESKVGSSINNLVKSMTANKRGCHTCGKTFDEIQQNEFMGCPECYISFQSELKTMLEKRGLDFPYAGSMPKKLEHFRSILTDRIEIQKKLEDSIAHEEYEKAAMYRDFLRTLEHSAVLGSDEGKVVDK